MAELRKVSVEVKKDRLTVSLEYDSISPFTKVEGLPAKIVKALKPVVPKSIDLDPVAQEPLPMQKQA